jgi:C_GCAxxG_C_C family probable redox protein
MDDLERMAAFKREGFFCSQILILVALEAQGKENRELVRAMHALSGGLGFTGEVCGALTGGACLLGLYSGRGAVDEEDNPRLNFMVEDLVKWFKGKYVPEYGDIRCESILGPQHDPSTRCPPIVASTWQKVKELLVENGYDLYGLT